MYTQQVNTNTHTQRKHDKQSESERGSEDKVRGRSVRVIFYRQESKMDGSTSKSCARHNKPRRPLPSKGSDCNIKDVLLFKKIFSIFFKGELKDLWKQYGQFSRKTVSERKQ